MKRLNQWLTWFRWFRRDEEMSEEIRLHLEHRTEEFIAEGLSREEARDAALRQFGGVDQVKEQVREQRAGATLEAWLRDLRHAFRGLRHSPLFTITAVITLAVGLGANTAMFSIVDTLLLKPAPYPNAHQLVRIHRTASQSQQLPFSLPDHRDLRAQAHGFTSIVAYQNWAFSLAAPGEPAEHVPGVVATSELFATLGLQPSLGRAFTADEQVPGRDRVAVLSDDFWQRKYGRDPSVIGRSLRLDGEDVTIIGVMPARASWPLLWGRVDVWRPLPLLNDWREQRAVHWLNLIGRLPEGTAMQQAQTDLNTIAGRLAQEFPETNAGSGIRILPLHESVIQGTGRSVTWLSFGLAVVVLLIACANLASLQLARAIAHAHQRAVRVALGASRGALIRQSFLESLLLTGIGAGLGLVLAGAIGGAIGRQIDAGGDVFATVIDARVLVFAAVASLVSAAVFGIIPAWISSRVRPGELLQQQSRSATGSPSQNRARRFVLIGEIAMTLVLLGTAAVFLRGLEQFARRDLGWRSANVLTGVVTLPEHRYGTVAQRRLFQELVLKRAEQLPGVQSAALASAIPISAETNAPQPVYVAGRAAPQRGHEPLARFTAVSPHYFATMGVQLVRGRLIPDDIRPDSPPVAVISETMARTLWAGADPIGQRVSRLPDGGWREVIGVVRDVSFATELGASDTRMQVYDSFVQDPWGYFTIILRGPAAEALAQPLRRAVAELDPDLPVYSLRTVEAAVDESQHFHRLVMQVVGGFAVASSFLTAVGLYGVIAGMVFRRTREFGIRIALGAQPRDVWWPVLWDGWRLAFVGIACGVAGAFAAIRLLAAVMPALPTQTPLVVAGMGALVLGITGVACWIPAFRAAKVNPILALRTD